MGEICIPIPAVKGGQKAEISVQLTESNAQISYRVEVFSFKENKTDNQAAYSEQLLESLKTKIAHYDSGWELLQVYAPEGKDNLIKVLYRKR